MLFCPVSVVIPTYNRVDFLERALHSVVKQSCMCAQIIIVDDGSTDTTGEYLGDITLPGEVKLTVYHQPNMGPAAARNRGIHLAEQDIIAFLDSDDHWHKRKLEYQYAALAGNPDFIISHTGEKWLRRGVHLNQKKKHLPRHGNIFEHCLQLCGVGMSTVMVKKQFFDTIGYFDEKMRCCEDYDLWLRASCRMEFLLVDRPLTVKEGGREDQVSFQYRVGMDRWRIHSIVKLLDLGVLDCRQWSLAVAELEKKALVFGGGCIKHGKHKMGEYYLQLPQEYRMLYWEKCSAVKEG